MKDRATLPGWAKALILFHLAAIITKSLPPPVDPVRNKERPPANAEEAFLDFNMRYLAESPMKTYIQSLGLWQSWDMFSPNPSARDLWGDAIVQYKDGTERVLEFPRVYSAPIWAKTLVERFRKYYERAGHPDNAYLWPSLAQWTAMKAATDPANPPLVVVLRRHMFIVPDMMTAQEYFQGLNQRQGMEKWFPTPKPVIPDYTPENLFVWPVDQEQLAVDKGWKSP